MVWSGLVWSCLVSISTKPSRLPCRPLGTVSVRISFVISCVLVWPVLVLGLVGGVVVSCTCVCPVLPCPGLLALALLVLATYLELLPLPTYSPPAPTLPSGPAGSLATRNMTPLWHAANNRRPIWEYARSGESHADLKFPFFCTVCVLPCSLCCN